MRSRLLEEDKHGDPAGVGELTVEGRRLAADVFGPVVTVTLREDGRIVVPISRDALGVIDLALDEYIRFMVSNNDKATAEDVQEFEGVASRAAAIRAVLFTLERIYAAEHEPDEFEIDLAAGMEGN